MADKDTTKRDAAGRITSASTEDFIRMLTPPKKNMPAGAVTLPDRNVNKEDFMGSKSSKDMPEGAETLPYKPNKKAESEIKIVPLAKGGMTASKRADGIAQRGKTKGTMIMCGGGYTKGKK
jgi:hypothetical protein